MNRRKEIIKIKAEINKIESKQNDNKRSMNPRAESLKDKQDGQIFNQTY